ncbi:hypothetical protein GO988_07325 [Hymenobacter sp. HMF4947]|uniref:Uncharacterized protein n=1 Tax=Hymenobacter ginkgonis TaxID=2682976 RepID=A0A7K1TCT3_9BACT|nr:hypothetical protein [Hymenobacter ginkgonis]MVN76132.1 hypothetical protein [Hymenobacter ginkgonis]
MLRFTRPYFALLLLLCLVRTLLPEAWVLALHTHEHTTEEPAFVSSKRIQGKIVLTTKHLHCHAEQFYQVPFQAGAPVVVPLPPMRLSYRALAVPATLACSATVLRRTALRGPPVG